MPKAKKGPARKIGKKDKAARAAQAKMARQYEDKGLDADGYPRTSRRPVDTLYDTLYDA